MKRYIPSLITLAFFLIILGVYLTQGSVVKNEDVLNELDRIEQLGRVDEAGKSHIKADDFLALQHMVRRDTIASRYVSELVFLVENGEGAHLNHALGFMRDYVKTGKEDPCLPHELWHISLFVEHHGWEFANVKIGRLREDYAHWEESVEMKRQRFPQYYLTLDALKKDALDGIERLERKDYGNETLGILKRVGEKGLC